MRLGFAKTDITPRVGVELCGFGPFLNRHSTGVRDRLWARAMAVQLDNKRVVIISCDLIGVELSLTHEVRELVMDDADLSQDDIMLCCSHTHSGPNVARYIGWGETDPPYRATVPHRIADAACRALDDLQPASLHHAEVSCEGIGLNRVYEEFWAPYDEAMKPDWRPEKPELTDTTCHVLAGRNPDGALLGFGVYFGCHPVVCCSDSRVIHGDFPGVAINNVERDYPDSVGLFFQGAQGDVNTAIGGESQDDSLAALDEIAGRFAHSIRNGLERAEPININTISTSLVETSFSRKKWDEDGIQAKLSEAERKITAADTNDLPTDADRENRMNTVYAIALRRLLKRIRNNIPVSPPTEMHGIRLGPLALLGAPFETFQAIKNDVQETAQTPIPLVTSFVNDSIGYAVDTTTAANGGYAADRVPMICGELPFAQIHEELVHELITLDGNLND